MSKSPKHLKRAETNYLKRAETNCLKRAETNCLKRTETNCLKRAETNCPCLYCYHLLNINQVPVKLYLGE